MPHLPVDADAPGILGLLRARPDTAEPLLLLAETLLRRDDGLSRAERELLATAVSAHNGCGFCRDSHAAVAAAHLSGGDDPLVVAAKRGELTDAAPPRLGALARIAQAVASGGTVPDAHVDAALDAGADHDEIHDTVLIAAAFSMFNRYVDGLATDPATDVEYAAMGERLATHGYLPASSRGAPPGTATEA